MLPKAPAMMTRRSIALVIDDAPETLGMVSAALEENGMTVLVARSGEEGIDLAQRVHPDVILMDAMMPGLDGFETCRRLKSPPISEPAPVVFMTGMSEAEHILKGLQAGGVDYITKPVVIDELIARVTTHVLNARAISSARVALEYTGQNVLAFDSQGVLIWGTPAALDLIANTDETAPMHAGKASPAAKIWLSELMTQPMSNVQAHVEQGLVLTYLGSAEGEIVVRIRAESARSDEHRLLEAFGLTMRESEVLLWLSQGKTNRDIAEILSLSARTVNKHLEQIFPKMGVDNRTSAAVMADRVLQTSVT
ncbi:DNA-binding response regulator [Thalassovita sp.]|uniref:DNA-binding response regulator n=1 Tax=Thalassovita sp. TaxID=1979401 RepID=UPI002882C1A5|nr:DNA-binding response regulator [Thalassovita sp.]MDF1803316.1 DNA-binding response regulator [Thalassovita sp.]